MDDIKIKRLSAEDLGLILAVPEGIFDNPVDPIQAQAFLADPLHEMVVALGKDALIVGIASAVMMLHPDKQPLGFINEVGVADGFLRRGIGSALCAELFKILRGRGAKGIWLATEGDNAAARGLYTQMDGRETGDIVVFDWDGAMDEEPD